MAKLGSILFLLLTTFSLAAVSTTDQPPFGGKACYSQHFPTNLHILLNEAEKQGHKHIVLWWEQGLSFKIHDQDALVPLLGKYFCMTKFEPFLRELESYGFHRKGVKGGFFHPYFKRERPSLRFQMTRKQSGAAAAESVVNSLKDFNDDEYDFLWNDDDHPPWADAVTMESPPPPTIPNHWRSNPWDLWELAKDEIVIYL